MSLLFWVALAVASCTTVRGTAVGSRLHTRSRVAQQQHQQSMSRTSHQHRLRSSSSLLKSHLRNQQPSSVTEDELSDMSSAEEDSKSFEPGRILIAGNKKCVNKCSATNQCRAFGVAAVSEKNKCLGSCHRECSVCPLSSVTNDCRIACESQCAQDVPGAVCWHACLDKCPCEDLGDQLFDVLDLIPDYDKDGGDEDGGDKDVVDLSSGGDGIPVGIEPEAQSLMLQAALADKAAKAALLTHIRSRQGTLAGAQGQEKSQATQDKVLALQTQLEQVRINGGGEDEILRLEKEIKALNNAAAEQLQDGRLASVSAHDAQELSDNALSKAVEGVKALKESQSGGNSGVEAKLDQAQQAKALMDATQQTLCDAATMTKKDLETKSKTSNDMAATLYTEMEREQKGTSKQAADNAQKAYEEAANKAYGINEAYNAAKLKMTEACGDSASADVQQSLNQAQASKDLKRDAEAAMKNNDTATGWALESKSLRSELDSKMLALAAEDATRNTTVAAGENKMNMMTQMSTKATMNNQPELAQLLQQKITEMKTALHGVASLAADDLKTNAMRANEEALNALTAADQSNEGSDGSGKDTALIALQEAARAKVTEVMAMVEEARAALAKTSGAEQEDDKVLTVEQELEKRKNTADGNGDADKADHYNELLTSYRESTAAAEAASVVGGANVTETVENKFDLMYNKLLQGGYKLSDNETHALRSSMMDEDVNATMIKKDNAHAHRMETQETYRDLMGVETEGETGATGGATGGEDDVMQFKQMKTSVNPYSSIVVESASTKE